MSGTMGVARGKHGWWVMRVPCNVLYFTYCNVGPGDVVLTGTTQAMPIEHVLFLHTYTLTHLHTYTLTHLHTYSPTLTDVTQAMPIETFGKAMLRGMGWEVCHVPSMSRAKYDT